MFEDLDYPLDVIWLDIEHTDGKRYFTVSLLLFCYWLRLVYDIVRDGPIYRRIVGIRLCRCLYWIEYFVQSVFDYDALFDLLRLVIQWDNKVFPTPLEMQANVSKHGRKMVTIVDPHLKRDDNYFIHKEATSKGLYIKVFVQSYMISPMHINYIHEITFFLHLWLLC